jgi:hypothetical protein
VEIGIVSIVFRFIVYASLSKSFTALHAGSTFTAMLLATFIA